MSVPKTCILCQHMWFYGGEPDYSEYTPGSYWQAECRKKHWEMHGCSVDQDKFCENLMMAEGCKDFEQAARVKP